MRFKGFTFSLLSPLLGLHVGKNPASGQRFVHIALLPFVGLDFELPPYGLNERMGIVDNVYLLMFGDWLGQTPQCISLHRTRMGAINEIPDNLGLARNEHEVSRDKPYCVKEVELKP